MEGNRSAHFDSSGQGAKFDPFILNNKRRLLRSILFQSAQPIEAYDIVVLPPPLGRPVLPRATSGSAARSAAVDRSEEHTSELQSLLRSSYAVFCLKNKKHTPAKPFP